MFATAPYLLSLAGESSAPATPQTTLPRRPRRRLPAAHRSAVRDHRALSDAEAAEALRAARRFAEARDAFRRLAAQRPGDADDWADAADTAAAAAGGDLGAAEAGFDRALAAQPGHPQALGSRPVLNCSARTTRRRSPSGSNCSACCLAIPWTGRWSRPTSPRPKLSLPARQSPSARRALRVSVFLRDPYASARRGCGACAPAR